MLVYLCAAGVLGTIPREDILALYRGVRHKAQSTNPSPDENQLEIEQSSQALETEEEPQAAQEAIWLAGNAMKHMLDSSSTIFYQLDEDSEITEKRPRIELTEKRPRISITNMDLVGGVELRCENCSRL